jgi:hypothetical protein
MCKNILAHMTQQVTCRLQFAQIAGQLGIPTLQPLTLFTHLHLLDDLVGLGGASLPKYEEVNKLNLSRAHTPLKVSVYGIRNSDFRIR